MAHKQTNVLSLVFVNLSLFNPPLLSDDMLDMNHFPIKYKFRINIILQNNTTYTKPS